MSADGFGERTEQPTQRQLREARKKGNVPRSIDLVAAGHMLAAAVVLYFLGSQFTQSVAEYLRSALGGTAWLQFDRDLVVGQFQDIAEWTVAAVLPLLLSMLAVGWLVNWGQVGFLVAPGLLSPNIARLNPIDGLKRILSIHSLARLTASLGKLVVLVLLVGWYINSRLPSLLEMTDAEPSSIIVRVGQYILGLAFLLSLAFVLLALVDYRFQRWKHRQDLRMTKQEVRDELKSMEGDPQIRQRRREAHRKLTQARAQNNVGLREASTRAAVPRSDP